MRTEIAILCKCHSCLRVKQISKTGELCNEDDDAIVEAKLTRLVSEHVTCETATTKNVNRCLITPSTALHYAFAGRMAQNYGWSLSRVLNIKWGQ